MSPGFVAHTGQIGMVVAHMGPHTAICRVILSVPEIHDAEAIAKRHQPRTMGIVHLCIKIGLQVLLTVLTDIPGILVIHLRTDHQPKVGCENRGVEFDKTIGIVVTHLFMVVGRAGIVAPRLNKEDGIIMIGMRVREHKPKITTVVRNST